MKLSNEFKVGVLTIIAVTFLILGFNYLKGRSIFKTGNFLYAQFPNTKGLMPSNPVFINGFQVGNVYEIENSDPGLKNLVVTIKLKKAFNIPTNSAAYIKESALGSPNIQINLGNENTYLKSGDTLTTINDEGLLGALTSKIAPIGDQLKQTLHSLDSVLKNVNTILDPSAKGNLAQSIANVNKVTASLVATSASVETLLNAQNGAVAKTMNNVNSFTKNLADNNEKVTKTMANIEKTTENLSKADIDGTIATLKKSVDNLNNLLVKLDSKDGTIGLLMNDKQLYNNLTNTVRSANILMDDLKTHPKRYINVSVFGKKDKSTPLQAPLNDSALQKANQ
jgi:phospholipid/cholesterol/gamma-HCH transport system substrate-binding protein